MKNFCSLRNSYAISCADPLRAFTLVEVVFALGIVSFTLITLLGLLTVGIQRFHDAKNTTVESEISQQLANQLQLANYSSISANNLTVFYFTDEGVATNASSAIYTATISAPTQLIVPGASNPTTTNTNTLAFVIAIKSVSSPQITNSFPIQVANNGS